MRQITANDGLVLFDAKNVAGERAVPADVAACETDVLRDVIASGTGTAARLGTRPVAGKTGTTDDKTDASFLGFTPQLATFVWHGDPSAQVPGAGFGGEIPARIFQVFMSRALDGTAPEPFPDPGPVCARPGKAIAGADLVPVAPVGPPTTVAVPPVEPSPTSSPPVPTTSPTTSPAVPPAAAPPPPTDP